MSSFKSLLYREFRISRKSNILRICLSFGFLLFFWLIMVSIKNDEVINESVMNDNIKFVKVKAHAGNRYNELADKLAKKALSE